MALIDLNSIQFYQPPIEASLLCGTVPRASNANGLTIVGKGKPPKGPGPSDGWNGTPWGDDPIEFIDITDSPTRENLSQFRESTADLKEIEADPRGMDFSRLLTDSC